ncbi:MAG TPA: hypothetical protein VJ583_02845 [Nitrososphaeraceae archaeon]|nr:hypothetical protein [Nitrososphaeraceae archaeon]
MKNPKWICSKCRQPFTRKWNANRHCNNKHSGRIENIISFTDYIIKRRDSIPLNSFYEDNSLSLNTNKNLLFDKPLSINNSQFDTFIDPIDDAIEHELSSYELLDELAPKYEEIQRILDFVPEADRREYLGTALYTAILSNNPPESMNKLLKDLQKTKTRAMMLNDLTASHGMGKIFTKELLKLKLKQKKYYHQFDNANRRMLY